MPDFFISYNKADLGWAKWLARQLIDAGYTVIYQAQDFRPGSNFVLEMQRALVESERVIAVLSPNYLTSRFAQAEWAAAFVEDPTGEKGKLVPIRVREFDLKGLHAPIVYLDLVDLNEEDARAALLDGLGREPVATATPPPFPGEASEARKEPLRFPGQLPPIWNVPHRRNPLFVGRDDLLTALEPDAASEERAVHLRSHAVHGLGGIGKTQLAVEAAYRGAPYYDLVWWLRAEDNSTLLSDYVALGKALGLLEADQADQPSAIEAIRRHLEQGRERWLLIFDNATVAAVLLPFLPRAGEGDILVTSRNPEWVGAAESLPLEVLGQDEAIDFLLQRTGQADVAAAATLAQELGYLPLALAQAAAYAAATGMTLARYLDLFQEHHRELLARGEADPGYPDTIATTWELSFQLVEAQALAARDLLYLCSFFAPESIPIPLLTDYVDYLPAPLASAVKDVIPLEDAKALLRRFSLIDVNVDETLSIHRLVQTVIRDRLAGENRRGWTLTALYMIASALPVDADDPRTWLDWEQLYPHAQAVASIGPELPEAARLVARINHLSGIYAGARGRLVEARLLLEKSLEIGQEELESGDPGVAIGYHNLARNLKDLSELDDALETIEKALAIDIETYGPEHPEVSLDLSLKGQILREQGKLDSAIRHLERALEIQEKTLDPDDRLIAITLNDLGSAYRRKGNHAAAKKALTRSLQIHESAQESSEREMAIVLGNLGDTYREQGQLGAAESTLKISLGKFEEIYDEDHFMVATARLKLSRVMIDQGNPVPARNLLGRALEVDEKTYGVDHPGITAVLDTLGNALRVEGRVDEAKAVHERALTIREAAFGPEHPQVATSLNNIADILQSQGDLDEARWRFESAVRIAKASSNGESRALAVYSRNLANVLFQQEDWVGARQALQTALPIWRKVGDQNRISEMLRFLRSIDVKIRSTQRQRRGTSGS